MTTTFKGRVLVAGATGRTGVEIVRRLRHYGIDFRLFVRSTQKAITLFGVDEAGILRVGSIQNKEETRESLKGIDAVFVQLEAIPLTLIPLPLLQSTGTVYSSSELLQKRPESDNSSSSVLWVPQKKTIP